MISEIIVNPTELCCQLRCQLGCAMVEREGLSPLFLLRAESGEPVWLFLMEGTFVCCIYLSRVKTNEALYFNRLILSTMYPLANATAVHALNRKTQQNNHICVYSKNKITH